MATPSHPPQPTAFPVAPAPAAFAPTVPPGTPVHTVWGWITAFIPVASLVLSTVQYALMTPFLEEYLRRIVALSASPSEAHGPSVLQGLVALMAPFMLTSLLFSLLGAGVYAFGVVAAYRDHAALGRLGYVRRFPWAWGFLVPVYPIGRAIVVHRQAGAGRATMWIAIAASVTTLLVGFGWSIWTMFAALQQLAAIGTMP